MLTDGLTTNRLLVGGWLVSETRDTPYDGSTETANPLQERTDIRVWLITADARITTKSGVQVSATIPDITRSAVVARADGSEFHYRENFSGIGDTSIVAWHRLPVRRGFNVTLNAGVSVPTGKTERPRFLGGTGDGSLVPASRLQRGSGTWDPLIGVSANRLFTSLFYPGVRGFASVAARLPFAENEHGLRTGASWEASMGASREVKWESLIAIVRVGWLHREQDVFEGAPVLVGGGNWLHIAPAVAIALGKFTAQAELKLPIYRDLANRQLDALIAVQLGLVRSF